MTGCSSSASERQFPSGSRKECNWWGKKPLLEKLTTHKSIFFYPNVGCGNFQSHQIRHWCWLFLQNLEILQEQPCLGHPSSLQPQEWFPSLLLVTFTCTSGMHLNTAVRNKPPRAQSWASLGVLGLSAACISATLVEAEGEGRAVSRRRAFSCNRNCLAQPRYESRLKWIGGNMVQILNESRHRCHTPCWKRVTQFELLLIAAAGWKLGFVLLSSTLKNSVQFLFRVKNPWV